MTRMTAGDVTHVGEIITFDTHGILLEHHDCGRTRIPYTDIRSYEEVQA